MRVKEAVKGEQVEVLSNKPIADVILHPPTVIGTTPGTHGEHGDFDTAVAAESVQLTAVAPVIADATAKGRQELPEEEAAPAIRTFAVLADKTVRDGHGSGRVTFHTGKEITNQHYNIRDLMKQGLKLREITGLEADEPIPNY